MKGKRSKLIYFCFGLLIFALMFGQQSYAWDNLVGKTTAPAKSIKDNRSAGIHARYYAARMQQKSNPKYKQPVYVLHKEGRAWNRGPFISLEDAKKAQQVEIEFIKNRPNAPEKVHVPIEIRNEFDETVRVLDPHPSQSFFRIGSDPKIMEGLDTGLFSGARISARKAIMQVAQELGYFPKELEKELVIYETDSGGFPLKIIDFTYVIDYRDGTEEVTDDFNEGMELIQRAWKTRQKAGRVYTVISEYDIIELPPPY